MNSGKTVFSQLMDFLPSYEFRRCVDRYQGNYKVKSFSCKSTRGQTFTSRLSCSTDRSLVEAPRPRRFAR